MAFGTLDLNNLVLLVIAALTLFNTLAAAYKARQDAIRLTLAQQTNAIAIETRNIAIDTKKNTDGLVVKLVSAEKQVSHAEGFAEGEANKS